MLYQPYRVRYHDPTGTLFICDTYNHRVRRVTADGVITTVAGNGEEGFSGDRGPADQARLALPYDARVGPDGAIYIADSANNRIRRVGEDGVITTVAGNGARGYSGDRGPALNAAFNNPSAVAFDEEGNLWIADTYNSAVRKVVRFFQTP
jgi:sugar lactone lactonase YvrE